VVLVKSETANASLSHVRIRATIGDTSAS